MDQKNNLMVLLGTVFIISSAMATTEEMKISNSKINSPRFQYMEKLQSLLTDAKENSLTTEPTSVFCLADYGEILAVVALKLLFNWCKKCYPNKGVGMFSDSFL